MHKRNNHEKYGNEPEWRKRGLNGSLQMYSEKEKTDLFKNVMRFLETHKVFELLELVASAIAMKEQK